MQVEPSLNQRTQVQKENWTDWRWQLRHAIKSVKDLPEPFKLSFKDSELFSVDERAFSIGITPYYANLFDLSDPHCPIAKTVIPSAKEFAVDDLETLDPLAEDEFRPVPAIVHRYKNRCLFMVTGRCATYCRYCTRSRLVGDPSKLSTQKRNWDQGIEYINNQKHISDVVLSGGDPLTLNNDDLEYIVSSLRAIPHVEIIRIGTKLPVVLPYRIDSALVQMLKKYGPIYWSIHVTHPRELTVEAKEAISLIADAGMPIGSQTVLLKDVNDNEELMLAMMKTLLRMRVKPYYLYLCDRIPGSNHFAVDLDVGRKIMRYLKEHIGGYGLPKFVTDQPGSEGKMEIGY